MTPMETLEAAVASARWQHIGRIDELDELERDEKTRVRCLFGVFDTEDDSKELMESGRSGFDKSVTQIAGVTCEGRKFHNRGDVSEFLKFILNEKERRGVRRWYAHNLQYDIGNVFGDDLDSLDLCMVGGRLIRAVWRGIIFLDSFNLFPTSVKKLGQALGLEKLEMDVRSMDYVFRDCDIVREALERLIETCREFGVEYPANTLGGLCVKLWQAMGGTNWPDHSLESRAAIFGGRVELFSRGGRGNIAWTDINSLYPWAMTQAFPHELELRKDRNMPLAPWGITTATVRVPEQFLAPLPYRVTEQDRLSGVYEHAIIFPCGRFTGTWTNHELRNAVELHGVVIEKIHAQFASSTGEHCYRSFVETFYQKRLAQKNEAYRLIYKLLMNNLYGQLGMGGGVTRTAVLDERREQEIREGLRTATVFGSAVMFDVRIPLPEHVNYAHAAHVTSFGRLRLMEFARKVDPSNLIYCDTDSLMFFNPFDAPLPFTCGDALGEMKLEGMGRRIEVHAPKTYRIVAHGAKGGRWQAHPKAKGVPKAHAQHFLDTGWAEYDAPFKIREAINFFDRAVHHWRDTARGPVPVYCERPRANSRRLSVWRTVRKELRSQYHKKKARADGSFTPLVLSL